MVTQYARKELQSELGDETAFDIEVKVIEWKHPHIGAADLVSRLGEPVSD